MGQTHYQEQSRRTESWLTEDDQVWSLARQAAAGMLSASYRQTAVTPAHTDYCERMLTTDPSRGAAGPGRAWETSSGHRQTTDIDCIPHTLLLHYSLA